jgi:hypothetical protein
MPFNHLPFIAAAFILFSACMGAKFRIILKRVRYDRFSLYLLVFYAAIELSAAACFITPYIGNGLPDIAKHMFGFVFFFDVMLVLSLAAIIEALSKLAPPKPFLAKLSFIVGRFVSREKASFK